MNLPLLEVNNLTVQFRLKRGILTAVDNVCFTIDEKETLGIVGETGCGKSATALSILRLISAPPGRIVGGEILFEGDDLLRKSEHEMEKIRGHKISMIFQEPMTSFNPSFTIGEQIAESYRIHLRLSKKIALESTQHILDAVRVPSPRTIMARYPHQLSGGMRQRAMIAMALACQPRLLIADEPTTALDVTIQAQILELLEELQEQMKMAMLFISHNLGVMARLCNRIGVMYAGSLVELADKKSLFTSPLHPYTIGLLRAVPRRDRRHEPLKAIPGNVCSLLEPPPGCRFHPRCSKAKEICRAELPSLENLSGHHHPVACYFPGE
jgi:oligopeptide/dipeptide ABC transporter ATP-binding protein